MGFFNFLKRKPVSPPLTKIDAAYEKGREVGAEFMDALTAYVDSRAAEITENYLTVFQSHLDQGREQVEFSPMLWARTEYSLFLENVNSAIEKLISEAHLVFSEWDSLHEEIGVKQDVDSAIADYVSSRIEPMKIAGLTTLTDNVPILKAADDRWRKQFPEQAAEQPL